MSVVKPIVIRCADKNLTIIEFGVCPDCEEVYEAEEDYWGWGEEEE